MTISARVLVVCVALSSALWMSAAIKQPIRKPSHDPAVPAVDLFDAIDRNTVETTVVAKNSHAVNLFVTNKSAVPVSVKLPDVVTAVQVLKQFAGPGLFNGAANGAGAGPGGAAGGGQAQSVGGTGNSGGNAFGNGNGNGNGLNGNGIFTVPSGKTVQVPLRTVCLAYGQAEPNSKMQYKLVRVEDFTSNAELRETLNEFAAGRIDMQVAQAAAWHITDRRTWTSLAEERIAAAGPDLGALMFTSGQLDHARRLTERIQADATNKAQPAGGREVTARNRE